MSWGCPLQRGLPDPFLLFAIGTVDRAARAPCPELHTDCRGTDHREHPRKPAPRWHTRLSIRKGMTPLAAVAILAKRPDYGLVNSVNIGQKRVACPVRSPASLPPLPAHTSRLYPL